MADSDNSTTLPFVTRRRKGATVDACDVLRAKTVETGDNDAADPAIVQARVWHEAHRRTLALCRLQQRLETRLVKAGRSSISAASRCSSETAQRQPCDLGYLQAKDAEARSADAERLLLDDLARTPAQTMDGVLAKLEVFLLEGEVSDAPSYFPWPQLQLVLEDLRKLGAQRPHTALSD